MEQRTNKQVANGLEDLAKQSEGKMKIFGALRQETQSTQENLQALRWAMNESQRESLLLTSLGNREFEELLAQRATDKAALKAAEESAFTALKLTMGSRSPHLQDS